MIYKHPSSIHSFLISVCATLLELSAACFNIASNVYYIQYWDLILYVLKRWTSESPMLVCRGNDCHSHFFVSYKLSTHSHTHTYTRYTQTHIVTRMAKRQHKGRSWKSTCVFVSHKRPDALVIFTQVGWHFASCTLHTHTHTLMIYWAEGIRKMIQKSTHARSDCLDEYLAIGKRLLVVHNRICVTQKITNKFSSLSISITNLWSKIYTNTRRINRRNSGCIYRLAMFFHNDW